MLNCALFFFRTVGYAVIPALTQFPFVCADEHSVPTGVLGAYAVMKPVEDDFVCPAEAAPDKCGRIRNYDGECGLWTLQWTEAPDGTCHISDMRPK